MRESGQGGKLGSGEEPVSDEPENQVPSAAKAAIDFVALTARLKRRPFKANSN